MRSAWVAGPGEDLGLHLVMSAQPVHHRPVVVDHLVHDRVQDGAGAVATSSGRPRGARARRAGRGPMAHGDDERRRRRAGSRRARTLHGFDVARGLEDDEDHVAVDLELGPLVGVIASSTASSCSSNSLGPSRTPPRWARRGRSTVRAVRAAGLHRLLHIQLPSRRRPSVVTAESTIIASRSLRAGRERSPPPVRAPRPRRPPAQLAHQPAQLGPRLHPELVRQMVAAHRRGGGPAHASPAPPSSARGPARGAWRSPPPRCARALASRSAQVSTVTSTSTGSVRWR